MIAKKHKPHKQRLSKTTIMTFRNLARKGSDMAIEELEITSKEALKAAEILNTYCTDAPNNNCEEIKCSLYQWCVKGE